MKKSDVTCPERNTSYRRIESTSIEGTKGELFVFDFLSLRLWSTWPKPSQPSQPAKPKPSSRLNLLR